MTYDNILVEIHDRAALIRMNRTSALNALNAAMIGEINHIIDKLEKHQGIGCLIIAGSDDFFSAGADIKEMQNKTFAEAFGENMIENLECISRTRKPMIAAVAGPAMGGGCELAMMCDMIIAADNAIFGQPELSLGIMPGAGGTQRLTRFIGKAKAMDMCLTGRKMNATEAERAGLVSQVVPNEQLIANAIEMANKIAAMPITATMMIKEAIKRAYETTMDEGILFERRGFHALFSTRDQKEGMAAFIEKRPARFENR